MAICGERAVPLAFYLCCFYSSAVLVSLSRLVFRAGHGIRLYQFLINVFLSTLEANYTQKMKEQTTCIVFHPFQCVHVKDRAETECCTDFMEVLE